MIVRDVTDKHCRTTGIFDLDCRADQIIVTNEFCGL